MTATLGSAREAIREALSDETEMRLKDLLILADQKSLAQAWARGDIEVGRTKYVVTGNPDVPESNSCLVIETGIEWSGRKQVWHGKFAGIVNDSLPVCRRYQKYQKEVCVNREKDVWEWLGEDESPRGRETRWARRDIDRAEAERLFDMYVRLTDQGLGDVE